jgi:NADH-ubiquinone oxidoreductase chain 3
MTNLLFLFIFIPILAFILLALNILLAPHKPDENKISAYECGFLALPEQTRSTFQIHFMIVALLFLIFDLEILLLFPLAVSLYQVSIFGFSIGIIFFIILTIGFVLEIGKGAIALTNFSATPDQTAPAYLASSASLETQLLSTGQDDKNKNKINSLLSKGLLPELV